MRTAAFLILLLVAVPALTQAQGLMRFYRMAYGISGFYSNGSSTLDIGFPAGTTGSEVNQESIRLSTRLGHFFSRNFVMGIEFNWEQGSSEVLPDPNPIGYRLETYDRRLFLGPLFRWYQPMTHRWFLYPEVSVGYSHYLGETQENSLTANVLPSTTTARGIAVNAGAGVGYFLTRNVVFDASLRYMRAWRTGEYEVPGQPDVDVDITEYDIQLYFGLQLLI
jgi:hypothetical protein